MTLSQSFVGREEKGASANDRPPERAAELVPLEGGRIRRRELEEVPRIERIVPEKLVRVPAKLVAARTGHQVHDRSRHVSVFGTERRVVDLEFLDARDRRRKANRTERQVVRGHAVDHVANGLLTIAGRVEGERSGPPNRRGRESRLRGRDRPGYQRPEIDKVPAIERDLLYRPGGNHVAHRAARPIHEREILRDDDGFSPVTQRQVEVAYQRPADLEGQIVEALGLETRRRGGDLIDARRNRRDEIPSSSVRGDRQDETRGLIPHRDRCAGNDRARGIEHAALQHRRGLCGGRRGPAEQGRQHERHPVTRNLRGAGTRSARRSPLALDYFRRTNRLNATNRAAPEPPPCLVRPAGASGAHWSAGIVIIQMSPDQLANGPTPKSPARTFDFRTPSRNPTVGADSA